MGISVYKMAATAVRTVKTVRQHIPSIKFPSRSSDAIFQVDVAASSSSVVSPPVTSIPVVSSQPQILTNVAESYQRPFGSTPRGTGIDPTLMPARFRRKPIDLFEMEFIEKGGAV